jgi:hypothetical protein
MGRDSVDDLIACLSLRLTEVWITRLLLAQETAGDGKRARGDRKDPISGESGRVCSKSRALSFIALLSPAFATC